MRAMDSRYGLKQMILFIASEMQGAPYDECALASEEREVLRQEIKRHFL